MRLNKNMWAKLMLVTLVIISSGCESVSVFSDQDSGLSASGVVETVEVKVAPEVGGRVAEVNVNEGDAVQAGDLLLRMDDELLQSQRQEALATLDAAGTNLSTSATGLEMADATLSAAQANLEVVSANAEVELLVAQQAHDDLYKTHAVAKTQAQQVVAAANRAVREAKYQLYNFTVPVNQKDLSTLEAIAIMDERLDQARAAFEPYRYRPSGDKTREDMLEALDEAQADYDAAVRRMEYETAVDQAKATLEKAMQDFETLQDGPDPADVALLEARIAAAEAAPKQVQAGVVQAEVGLDQAQAQIDQAQKTVAQAQAALDLIDTQMNKLTISAPVSGVVMMRNIEPGEVLQPGATALVIGKLDEMTVTVYIPENQYGQIKVGDPATVSADSFPGESFEAVVIRIADRAEYTPRNVQTKEDRATTVFAIKLAVKDPEGKLKPGMPVDVGF